MPTSSQLNFFHTKNTDWSVHISWLVNINEDIPTEFTKGVYAIVTTVFNGFTIRVDYPAGIVHIPQTFTDYSVDLIYLHFPIVTSTDNNLFSVILITVSHLVQLVNSMR